jgi:hypothetical protein
VAFWDMIEQELVLDFIQYTVDLRARTNSRFLAKTWSSKTVSQLIHETRVMVSPQL